MAAVNRSRISILPSLLFIPGSFPGYCWWRRRQANHLLGYNQRYFAQELMGWNQKIYI